MSDKVKVLVIEDHPIVSDGCQRILGRRADISVRKPHPRRQASR